MKTSAGSETHAARLRSALAEELARKVDLEELGWRAAVETVPRHRFVRGFYLPSETAGHNGLKVWEPVTASLDPDRWLAAAYSDTTLITQFDGEEPDWNAPTARQGGAPTSSSTLPSLVTRMWADADVTEEHTVLEIGTGTGYSTALACERLGSAHVTSIDVDPRRLESAADSLYECGYTPTLAVADGLYGYWPEAWFDRIVATCSFRAVPSVLVSQTRPGGKILLPLSGWLYGYARALLTVAEDGTAEGPLVSGTVSFMSARVHAAPPFGNPAHWAAGLPETPRPARHSPERITAPTEEAFQLRFLAQCAVPRAQLIQIGRVVHLVDVVTGSAATLSPHGDAWDVREGGPVRLWERVEHIVTAFDVAERPAPETFTLRVRGTEQQLLHPDLPDLALPELPRR